jgi:ribosome biogenesis protein Nip4
MFKPATFDQFCRQFTDKPLPHVVKIGKRYFFDPKDLLKVAQEHKWDVFSVGLYLGEERKEFTPTSAFIDLLAARNDQRVAVGNKAAWLFVCGRDILMDGVLEAGDLRVNDLAFVVDHKHNLLGYGRIVAPYHPKMRNKTYLKHVLDKGEYLRRER